MSRAVIALKILESPQKTSQKEFISDRLAKKAVAKLPPHHNNNNNEAHREKPH